MMEQRFKIQHARAMMFSLVCGVASVAVAQQDSIPLPTSWSYADCVEYAKANNIQLQQSYLTRQSSDADLEAAKGEWLPTFDFATTQSVTNYPSPADGKHHNTYSGTYGINAGWTVYDGNTRGNNIKRGELQNVVNDMSIEEINNNLETQILGYYLQILYAREAIDIAKQTLEVSEAQMKRAEQLMLSGKMSKVDYVQLESQYHTDRYNVVTAENNYESQKTDLKQLLELGIGYDMVLDSLEFSEELIMQPLPDKETVYAVAITWLPELRGKAIEQQMSDIDIKIARAGYLPSISLNGSIGTMNVSGTDYSFGSQFLDNLNEQIGITLSFPIFDGKKTKTSVAKARIDKLNSVLEYRSLQNDIAQSIENAYLDARSSQAQYISGKEQLKSAELTDELTNEQFKLGLVNTLDLLSSHNALLSARQQLLQAKYMALMNIKMLEFYQHKGISLP